MKKMCVLVLSLALMLAVCFPMSVAAASNKYDLSELGLEVTIPEGYTVITRDTPADDPIFNALGTTKTAIINQLEASNIYLNALSDRSNEEIVVTMEENIVDNFSLFSDTSLNVLASTLVDQYANYGMNVSSHEIYHHAQAKFIKVYFSDAAKTVHGLQYYTIYDGKAINFTMRSYEGSISSRQENAIKATVDSILFDNSPPVPEQGEDTQPFQYTHADTGLVFIVPANWTQEEFSENREYIDAKFTSNKEAGCGMIFGCTDLWSQMSAVDRIKYTLSGLDNSAFTVIDIAEIYNTTVDKISTVTYNGIEYYKGEINATSDVYGIDVEVTVTQLVRIENGWMYFFQFSGTSSHELYSDFEKLLESVIYPPVPDEEETEPTQQTTLSTYHSNQHSNNASPNASQNASSNGSRTDSKNNTGVIAAVVLPVIVPAIVAAVVVIRKKKTKATGQPDYSTNGNAPETKPESDAQQVVCCKECGQRLPSDSSFCHMCGTKIDRELRL